jgi:hypothetical protein
MALVIEGKAYAIPGESGTALLTGRELIAIEDYFGLDGMRLIGVFAGGKEVKGYTQVKAIYALAWVCKTRAGEAVSFDDVLDIPSDQMELTDDEPNPTEAA